MQNNEADTGTWDQTTYKTEEETLNMADKDKGVNITPSFSLETHTKLVSSATYVT